MTWDVGFRGGGFGSRVQRTITVLTPTALRIFSSLLWLWYMAAQINFIVRRSPTISILSVSIAIALVKIRLLRGSECKG